MTVFFPEWGSVEDAGVAFAVYVMIFALFY
jgi:hypothetical protein